jgi:hypothetical protein
MAAICGRGGIMVRPVGAASVTRPVAMSRARSVAAPSGGPKAAAARGLEDQRLACGDADRALGRQVRAILADADAPRRAGPVHRGDRRRGYGHPLHRQEDKHVLIGRRAHLDPLAEAAALRPRAAAVGAKLAPVEQDGGHGLGRLDLAAPDAAGKGRGRQAVACRPRPGAAVEHQLQREERIAPVMGLGRVPQRQVVHAGRALGGTRSAGPATGSHRRGRASSGRWRGAWRRARGPGRSGCSPGGAVT